MDGAGIGILIGALATALGVVIKHVSDAIKVKKEVEAKVAKEQRADALIEWQNLVTEQSERAAAAIRDMQDGMNRMQHKIVLLEKEGEDCQEESQEQRAYLHEIYAMLKQDRMALAKLGEDHGPMPAFPPLRKRTPVPTGSDSDMEFVIKQAQQSANLVLEAGKTITPPPPSVNGGKP